MASSASRGWGRRLAASTALVLSAGFVLGCSTADTDPLCVEPQIFGYRGARSVAPENTLAGIDLALAAGVDGVELDVQWTADEVLVVFHDETTARTTNDATERNVAELTFDELSSLDVGGWFGQAFAGERVPTLDEAVARIPAPLPIVFDLKTDAAVEPTIAFIRERGLESRASFSSFSWERLARLHRLMPSAHIGLCLSTMADLEFADDASADFVRLPSVLDESPWAWSMVEEAGYPPVTGDKAISWRAAMIMAGDPENALAGRDDARPSECRP